MTLYERYLNGEDGRSVYAEIYNLGHVAFDEKYFSDIQSVLTETFNRLSFNLNVIFSELKAINYCFPVNININSDRPLVKPLSDVSALLIKLDKETKDFGYVPLSLKMFYKTVGACNFSWDYERLPDIPWQGADPIEIVSLDDLVDEVSDEGWAEFLTEILEDDPQSPYLELSPDYLHKDNVSGGLPYSIQLTKEPSIDSLFLNESSETTFIDYLRICVENCGFPGMKNSVSDKSFNAFCTKVKPQLKAI